MLQSDYETLADHAVGQFTSNKTPLNDSIVKIAEKNDLNADQIKRVIEMANTKAFLKVFKNTENKGKNVEFDVADPTKILSKFYKGDESCGGGVTITKVTVTKSPGSSTMGFGNTLEEVLGGARENNEVSSPLFEEGTPTSPQRKVVIIRLKKVASDLVEKVYDRENSYLHGVEKLAGSFKKMYGPDFGELEKSARLSHGEEANPILSDIRTLIGWSKEPDSIEKIAGIHIVEDTAELRDFNALYQCKLEQCRYGQGAKLANEKIRMLSK